MDDRRNLLGSGLLESITMVGQTVGKYRVVSRVGRGGMGTVYKAVDSTLERDVAIKCLNADLGDPDLLKRFRTEAITLARLNHPNIATLYELTEHDGQLLMVMEFVRGETLDRVSDRTGPMPLERAAQLCTQVLDALEHAHHAGVIHRDLKPANLMLTPAGLVKVMDFGLARIAGTEHLTNDGYMVGTPAYMSPEQVLGREIDGRADLYAMAVVLYRLLTSQLPFKADSGIAMATKKLNDSPTPVRQIRTELPEACEAMLERGLAKSPEHRYASAEAFKAELSAFLRNSRTLTAPTPSIQLPSPAAASPSAIVSSEVSVTSPAMGMASADEPTLPPTPSPMLALKVPVPDPPPTVTMPVPPPAPAQPAPAVRARVSGGSGKWLAVAAAGVVLTAIAIVAMLKMGNASTPPAATDAPKATTQQAAAPEAAAPSQPAAAPTPAPDPMPAPPATDVSAKSAATKPAAPKPAATKPAAAPPAKAPVTVPNASPVITATTPVRPALPIVTFAKVRLLVLNNDGKSRDHEASLRLDADSLYVIGNAETLESASYRDVIAIYHSHSREPQWITPAGTPAPVIKVGGGLGFLKGVPDWITVRTQRAFIPLRIRDEDLARVSTELEARTGTKVVRTR